MHSFDTNSSNVPAFLVKLWKLVDDPSCNDLILWSDSGSSFIIRDQARFAKDLLPQYFKHNNMASFIRQLNMYGFRKVMNYEKSGLRSESDEMEFKHAFFCKGQGDLLELIKRKIPNTKVVSEPTVKSNAKDILTDLTSIREKQENMDNMLLKMKQENELLWRELTSMRQKHKAQEQIIQKVIQFLVSIVQRSSSNIGVQRKMPRMLHDSPGNKGKTSQVTRTIDVLRKKNSDCFISVPQDKLVSPQGPVIHEVTDFDHEQDEPQISALSPDSNSEKDNITEANELKEIDCPLDSSLNSPINTSLALEPLSILEPLQTRSSPLSTDDCPPVESVLGIPLEYINIPAEDTSTNVISIPDDNTSDSISETVLQPGTSFNLTPENILIYSPLSKSDFDDTVLTESLQTPNIPTIHIEEPSNVTSVENSEQSEVVKESSTVETSLQKNAMQNEHNYQLSVSDSPSLTKSSLNKNSLSNHLLNVEEELNWLQDQITSNLWNIDPSKLLGLFNTDGVANNESLAGQIVADSNMKNEPNDIVGNELVQFTPSMLEVELDIDGSPFLDCLNQDAKVPTADMNSESADQKDNLLVDVLNDSPDQIAASAAAEFLLNSGTVLKQNSSRRPKAQKAQKSKRRKVK